MLLLTKHKIKKTLDKFVQTSFSRLPRKQNDYEFPNLTWYEYFKGGYEFYPPEVIERKMNETWSNQYYK